MKLKFFIIASIFASTGVLAHEGHDDIPGQIKALHGGVVKSGKNINMEMLVTNGSVQFYPLAHSGEDLKISEVKLSGSSKTPKGKSETLNFSSDAKSISTKINFKDAYRTDLEIKAQYKGKADNFKFLVEK